MVVSCYADTSIQDGLESRWDTHLKAEATRVRKLLAADPRARERFEEHLGSIRRVLESPAARQARGMAVFSAPGWEEAMAWPSSEPYEDRLVVDEEPYLVPLFAADYRSREYLLVLTNTHHGRIYAASRRESRLLDELDARVRYNRHTGDDGHRKDSLLHYQKELAHRVEHTWASHQFHGIILLGEHEALEGFRHHLPGHLAERVVHEAPSSWPETGPAFDNDVREVVDRAIEARQDRRLDAVEQRIREGFGVATGPQEVIDALRNGQVGELVLGPDQGEAGSRCPGCRSLFAAVEASCPYCKATCEKVNLWQEILRLAVRHNVPAHLVTPRPGRVVPNNIAALLLRDEPQWTTGPAGQATV